VTKPSVSDFMASTRLRPASGNTAWASAKADEVKGVVRRASERAPRSQQVHLGPSEIGVACDRQIVSKLLGQPKTNHVVDPWPSVVGTAVHAWLADAFELDNQRYAGTGASVSSTMLGRRWYTERRVTPHPDHAGTGDLYDAHEYAVLDHKVLGATTLAKVRGSGGPPRKYVAQLGLYGLGYMREGFRVDRVAIIAYPRTQSTLDDLYVWESPMDGAMAALLETVLHHDMPRRHAYVAMVRDGGMRVDDVPIAPSQDECYFCPFYRPDADGDSTGCPGK